MTIKQIVEKYLSDSLTINYAEAHTASDIILTAISESDLCENVTIKGGMLIYNLTKNINRPTTDLDFDILHFSIDEISIRQFIKKLNAVSPYSISMKKINQLHQLDYQGVRAIILIRDNSYSISFKMDIGVHVYNNIKQDKLVFMTKISNKNLTLLVNPKEQVIVEKLLSLARLGPISTRYKDIYDIYFLCLSTSDLKKLKEIMLTFLTSNKYPFNSISMLYTIILSTLNDKSFAKECSSYLLNITNINYEIMKNSILSLLKNLNICNI